MSLLMWWPVKKIGGKEKDLLKCLKQAITSVVKESRDCGKHCLSIIVGVGSYRMKQILGGGNLYG